jgi:hypothetical protein
LVFCVVGSNRIATSPDGITWTNRTAPSFFSTATGFIWNGSVFCAIVDQNNLIFTSADGVTWTTKSELRNNLVEWWFGRYSALPRIAWNGSVFCVVSTDGRAATSSNLTTWSYTDTLAKIKSSWTSAQVGAIAWNGSQFCIGGTNNKIATSPDGITWTFRSGLQNATSTGRDVSSIIWTGTQFYALSVEPGRVYVSSSPDGITWTYRGNASLSQSFGAAKIVWNGSIFCIAGTGSRIVATSPDGITWTNRTGLSSTAWGSFSDNDIAWNGSIFCVVGFGGRVATSPDGITWTFQSAILSNWGPIAINTVTAVGNQFYIGADSGIVATSTDGVTWTNRNELSTAFTAANKNNAQITQIIWTGALLGVIGRHSNSLTAAISYDAITWTVQSTIPYTIQQGSRSYHIAGNPSKFCIVGEYGKVITST